MVGQVENLPNPMLTGAVSVVAVDEIPTPETAGII